MSLDTHESERERLAYQVADRIELHGITLVSARIERGSRPPAGANLAVELSRAAKAKLESRNQLRVTADLRFRAKHVGLDDASAAEVSATFELDYGLPNDANFTQEHFDAFAELNGVFNAWPYFREFLQSSTVRLGLPAFTLPLLRISHPAAAMEESPTRG